MRWNRINDGEENDDCEEEELYPNARVGNNNMDSSDLSYSDSVISGEADANAVVDKC